MIRPTVGRMVLYTPYQGDKPLAAIVTAVLSDRCVNLAVFGSKGDLHSRLAIPLLQDDDPIPVFGRYCEWMPYQKATASGQIAPTLHYVPPEEKETPSAGGRSEVAAALKATEVSGAKRIALERKYQVEAKGFTAEHDDQHGDKLLACVSVLLLLKGIDPILKEIHPSQIEEFVSELINGDVDGSAAWLQKIFFKKRSRIEELTVAGAMIAAAIDALQRQNAKVEAGSAAIEPGAMN